MVRSRIGFVAALALVGALVAGCGAAPSTSHPTAKPPVHKTHTTTPSTTVTQPTTTAPSPTVAQIEQVTTPLFQSVLGVKSVTFGTPTSTDASAFQSTPSNATLGKVVVGSNYTFLGGWQPTISNESTAQQVQSLQLSLKSLLTSLPASAKSQMQASPTVYVAYAYASNGDLDFLIFWK